jgi:hypothetical protein
MKQFILSIITCLSVLVVQAQAQGAVAGPVEQAEKAKPQTGSQDDQEISIYPNPSNGVFTISLSKLEAKTADLRILNVIGNEIYHETLTNTDAHFSTTVDLNKLSVAKGLYYVKLETDNFSAVKRVVIK